MWTLGVLGVLFLCMYLCVYREGEPYMSVSTTVPARQVLSQTVFSDISRVLHETQAPKKATHTATEDDIGVVVVGNHDKIPPWLTENFPVEWWPLTLEHDAPPDNTVARYLWPDMTPALCVAYSRFRYVLYWSNTAELLAPTSLPLWANHLSSRWKIPISVRRQQDGVWLIDRVLDREVLWKTHLLWVNPDWRFLWPSDSSWLSVLRRLTDHPRWIKKLDATLNSFVVGVVREKGQLDQFRRQKTQISVL